MIPQAVDALLIASDNGSNGLAGRLIDWAGFCDEHGDKMGDGMTSLTW